MFVVARTAGASIRNIHSNRIFSPMRQARQAQMRVPVCSAKGGIGELEMLNETIANETIIKARGKGINWTLIHERQPKRTRKRFND